MKFGDRLRILLENQDISQRQFSQDLNLAPSTVGNYVRNLREPDFDTLKRFAAYFSVSTDYLLDYEPQIQTNQNLTTANQILSHLSADDQQLWIEQGKLLLRLHSTKNTHK